MTGLLSTLWRELRSPVGGVHAPEHHRAVTFGGHVLLGACAASGGIWWVGLIVAAVYWLWKERGDLKRGGAWRDGIEDTVAVFVGTFYGPAWWPFVASLSMGIIFAVAVWRRG